MSFYLDSDEAFVRHLVSRALSNPHLRHGPKELAAEIVHTAYDYAEARVKAMTGRDIMFRLFYGEAVLPTNADLISVVRENLLDHAAKTGSMIGGISEPALRISNLIFGFRVNERKAAFLAKPEVQAIQKELAAAQIVYNDLAAAFRTAEDAHIETEINVIMWMLPFLFRGKKKRLEAAHKAAFQAYLDQQKVMGAINDKYLTIPA